MIFQKEYSSKRRTAHLFKRDNDYIVICYDNGTESHSDPFNLEQEAITFAEEFVTNLAQNQQATVTRGCCD